MKRIKKILDPDFKKEVSKILKNLRSTLHDLHEAATRDPKTGVYNHQFFENIFSMELEKVRRGKQSLCLIGVDIDFFKKINDSFGHLTGDEVLAELAQTMQKCLRKYDILARFGGEEFFVLLPETKLSQAKVVAEKLRSVPLKNKKLLKYSVTISLGVTMYKDKDTFNSIMKRADQALYQSKENGRNRVSVL